MVSCEKKPVIPAFFLHFAEYSTFAKDFNDKNGMEDKMAGKGTSTTTYRMKLFCKHEDWLSETKKLYNQVTEFYYKLFLSRPELWELGSLKGLRGLEQLTLVGRDKKEPIIQPPFSKIPVYFRRAAINSAMALANNYLSHLKNWEENGKKHTKPGMASTFRSSPVFYQGMYKEWTGDTVILKLYTGRTWCWVKCKVKGQALPENGERLSPTLVLGKHGARLHVPVKIQVPDDRSVKERMEAGERICGVSFRNEDACAVCAVYTADGRVAAVRFVRGGSEFTHHSKRLLNQIKENRRVMGRRFDWSGANKKHWEHLKNLRDYWSHKVSREILDFCREQRASVIVVTQEDKAATGASLKYQEIQTYRKKKLGYYSALGLTEAVRAKLSYKAFREGIRMAGVRPQYTEEKCCICRSYLVKEEKKEGKCRCPEGHEGNRGLNTARNIALMARKKYGEPAA